MFNKDLEASDVIAVLRQRCDEEGSQRAWADKHGLSPQYVHDVLKGRRNISEAMAAALGFMRRVVFTPVSEGGV